MLRGLTLVMLLLLLSMGSVISQDDSDSVTFTVRIDNIAGTSRFEFTGAFDTPLGATSPAPILPGESYEFLIPTFMGERLAFVAMIAESNDLFIAPDELGIELYTEDGSAPDPDITSQLHVWDLGTEINEPFGAGENQAPRQSAPNTGDDENGVVTLASELDDGFEYPLASDIVNVSMVQTDDGNFFTVTITNVSDQSEFPTAITSGVWVLQGLSGAIFTAGEADYRQGLEALAEDGNNQPLATVFGGSDFTSPITQGVWVVDTVQNVFFTENEPDIGDGLENLAEDGDPSLLADYIMINDHDTFGIFTTPFMTTSPAPITSGQSYEFSFTANAGDNLQFVTMLAESNDIFFAPDGQGIPLFDSDGNPISGDITQYIELWDLGTEVNEELGEGDNQAPRQSTPNSGDDENSVVRLVTELNGGIFYPPAPALIRVTISIDD